MTRPVYPSSGLNHATEPAAQVHLPQNIGGGREVRGEVALPRRGDPRVQYGGLCVEKCRAVARACRLGKRPSISI